MPSRARIGGLLATLVFVGCTPASGENDAPPQAHEVPISTTAKPNRGLRWTDDEPTRRAPVSLTASDGTGLRLASFKARGVVEDPLAFTELHLVFENPTDRRIEGRFSIDMPPHAAISRFAMKIGGAWQEGEVVERQAARVAFEDFLHRRQDPALLENSAGNSFTARVFPIEARERKELVVSYSQELVSSAEPYRLMLRGLPQLEELDASVVLREPHDAGAPVASLRGAASTRRVIRIDKQNYQPDRDLEVRGPTSAAMTGLRHESLVVARVAMASDVPPAPIGSLTVLFDTSASRALGFEHQVRRLGEVLEETHARSGEDFQLRVLCFDQSIEEVYAGSVSDLEHEHLARILARRALGASDLEGALQALARHPKAARRLLVVSDGIATAGSLERVALRAVAAKLVSAGFTRIDAIVDGGIRDASTLEAIVTPHPRGGVVLDARLPARTIADKLGSATLPPTKVTVPGANWVWPEVIEGAQPGDELLVYADLPREHAMHVVFEGDDTITLEIPTVPVERPLLERAWVGARIEHLQAMHSDVPELDAATRAYLRHTILEHSIHHRVLSDFTALLVLETEADYSRFGIDRRALADILTVGPAGVELLHRQPPAAFAIGDDDEHVWGGLPETAPAHGLYALRGPTEPPSHDANAEALDVGGLGLVGTGRGGGGLGDGLLGRGGAAGSGYGRGAGAGFGSRGGRVPIVRPARAHVRGGLDRDIIRRVVRAHLNEVRYCYNQGLVSDPASRGRVALRFTIDGRGQVIDAAVQESTLSTPRVGSCMARAVRRWRFPRPLDGGRVTVEYPFGLAPGEAPVEAPRSEASQPAVRPRSGTPHPGPFLEVQRLIESGKPQDALARATRWREGDPGDVLALLALGEANEAAGDLRLAARAYGSIIDLFPARADLRRYAGARLEALGDGGIALAVDTYRKAVASRPDHPSGHRLLAYALLKSGRPDEAFQAIRTGLERRYPPDRFAGFREILRDDLGLIGAAWMKADREAAFAVPAVLASVGASLPDTPSTRFVINWETDVNDVDFHVRDASGRHAYYRSPELPSGGRLYADVTTGYGPECFTIEGRPKAYPYALQAHYYRRGPMGYGMGKLQIVQHDGRGDLRFDERPFVIFEDGASVDLGQLTQPL